MRAFLFGLLGFVVGAVVAALAVFFGYVAFTVVTDYHDFEGAGAMGLAFFWAPAAALLGGIVAAILFVQWFGRPRAA